MNREDVDENLKWDLSAIYFSDDDFYLDYNLAKNSINNIAKYKDCFLNNVNIFLEFMKLIEDISIKIDKMDMYANLYTDVEPNNDKLQKMYSDVKTLYSIFNTEIVFIDSEIIKNSTQALEIIKDNKARIYAKQIRDILRNQPHMLSEEIENILAQADEILENPYNTYTVVRPEFKPVIIDGKEHFLNEETYKTFSKNKNENVRKQAYENLFSEFKKFSNIYASTLTGTLKKDVFLSKVRKFNSPVEASLFNDDVPKELFYKVLDMANNKYHKYRIGYLNIMKKILNKESLHIYDLNVPLVDAPNMNYSLDTAFELIFEATKHLGEDYKELLQKAKDERWIDYLPHVGKRHGAYSARSFGVHPFILMSYTNDIESIYTLIHELGHSMHTCFSQENQPYPTHSYRIFVAEVASIVNEILLTNLLINNAKTKEEKAYFLYRKIQEFVSVTYSQTFFAEFENILHEKLANNESLSNQTITDLYQELTNKSWDNLVELNQYTKYSCYRVPHFYYNYYVYKYTVGYCVAFYIASKISSNNTEQIEKYLNFLKSGGSKSPVELLKDAGVDPLEDKIYDEAFVDFKNTLDEFEQLINN